MNIDIKDSVVLDDNNEYAVVSKVNFENRVYYYLVDIKDSSNLKICYEDYGSFVESNDKDINTKLLPLFYEVSRNLIEEFNEK